MIWTWCRLNFHLSHHRVGYPLSEEFHSIPIIIHSLLVQSPDLQKLRLWHQYNSVEKDMILFSATYNWTSRFNMMTLNEVSLNRPKIFPDLLRHLLFLQVEPLPYRHEILRWDSLSLRWIPVWEWVLGIRSFSLIILLNHLPQEKQILHLFELSGLPSHSVFWDVFLMHLFLALSIIFFSNFPMIAIRIFSSQILLEQSTTNKTPRNNFFQFDEFLLCLSWSLGDIQSLHQIV